MLRDVSYVYFSLNYVLYNVHVPIGSFCIVLKYRKTSNNNLKYGLYKLPIKILQKSELIVINVYIEYNNKYYFMEKIDVFENLSRCIL